MLTVTIACSSAQGEVPLTVYTYSPDSMVVGSNVLPTIALGPLHVPPASGAPPSCANRSIGEPVAQTAIAPSVPGFGGVFTFTVTTATSFGQGVLPATV